MKIEILGSGCAKCRALEERAKEAVKKTGIDASVEHIFDLDKIIQRGAFSTPALSVDGKIVFSGGLPSVDELIKIIRGD